MSNTNQADRYIQTPVATVRFAYDEKTNSFSRWRVMHEFDVEYGKAPSFWYKTFMSALYHSWLKSEGQAIVYAHLLSSLHIV